MFFLSKIFKGECIYKNFNNNVYTKGFFLQKKKEHMFANFKDHIFTNFQRRVYLQKYIYFSFQK